MLKIFCITAALTLFSLPTLAKDYIITVGDRLIITVLDEPSLQAEAVVGPDGKASAPNQAEALVRPDGKITVPNCGEVIARGLTPDQLKEKITNKLRELIRNPVVRVTVTQFVNSRVYVLGGGVKSTSFDLAEQGSLLHLLVSIDDMSTADLLHNASLVRDGKEIKRDLYSLYCGDVSQDIPLKTGDTVVIPASAASRGVYVVGAVATPKMVPYREGMTVLEALLEAGGFTKFASPNHTKVVRKENGQKEIFEVKAKRLVRDGDLNQNIVLRGGDLVIVEEGFF